MPNKINFRLDHTMIRVEDLDKSLDFYVRIMGMKILRKNEYPEGRFTNVFIGYGPENQTTTIELTNNWDTKTTYEKGEGYGHLAFNVDDVSAAMDYLESEGVKIKSPAKPMNHGTRMLGFVFDPDGYIIELNEPLNQSS
ncbi:lactoylglutathione lyase [Amphritea balenae]|uniref:lactoylglutathione lyase n=1 Tax=Amphritea balenae TaxID=452629 RepID=A0A3P1SZ82_9GAMM|nr:lactoylglutathione lyase [Amphritea balenae]RRD01433.1 lactoylglutathione lyase [Amphritea balenae]GGK57170.1 lactoylglutathione lyase [Amphritea balenae]